MFNQLITLAIGISVVLGSNEAISPAQLQDLQKRFNSYYNGNSTISVKGITVGGWLVTEPYITPSLYEQALWLAENTTNPTSIVDEYTLCEALGYESALSLLQDHWDTWINEEDFKKISDDGFNLVRIPIGYWAWKQDNETDRYVGNITYHDPYVGNGLQLKYLEKALSWAQKYSLNVWIDLHGAPSSQNGFDNSGHRDLYATELGWLATSESRRLTLAVWKSIFESYLSNNSESPVVGIEIMNEPLSPKLDSDVMTKYYYEAFKMFKQQQTSDDNTTFVIHDAFEEIGHWNLHFNPQFQNVSSKYLNISNLTYSQQNILVDHHHYEVFTDSQLNNTQYQRIINIINYGESVHQELPYHPAVVGEWSGAITDCAFWLNGLGVGSRYDGSYYNTTNFTASGPPIGKCSSQLPASAWNSQYRVQVRQFIEAQLATYSMKTSGWIFWNWKTENATEWDYLKLKENGLFPSPFDNYTYFQVDGTLKPSVSKSLSKEATATSTKTKNAAVALRAPFSDLQVQPISLTIKTLMLAPMLSVALACIFL
ncbi:hypothetical protein HG536_0A06430 [Torulaspora globosa]|uniref:Glycoside hydrolase family 5 domain-containing protein n=1 Tax=Torulaspora globosa TaxID=48254 RepID=A0A7G3ZBE2_9SACH|nr:uncharacterized protein HG536_0A06430 [Torulaspora globosa]QLL30828.1 hypothetical protein HG536_0A06430 [Torulaspora globosa]